MESLDSLRAERKAFVEHFRASGEFDAQRARELERKLARLAQQSQGALQATALYELATVQRMSGRFDAAIDTYGIAAESAVAARLDEVAFDAWIGIARAHAYGTRDHGAAAAALARAREAAGNTQTQKQRYEIADYASQLESGRGELEAALVNALEANRLAADRSERFYAQLDAADALQKLAESCDYRQLIDARTVSEGGDGYGACRRAVDAAQRYYEAARKTATELGWGHLVKEVDGFLSRLRARRFLIEQRPLPKQLTETFTAQNASDVVVTDEFAAGASELSELSALAGLIGTVVKDEKTDDPRSLYLLGLRADLEGDSASAFRFFQRAVDALERERSSLFDLRRRGTVVENRPELVRDLGLRLLALGRLDEAFQAFESIRARGLGELAAILELARFTEAERNWLAALAQVQSQESMILRALVESTIAGTDSDRTASRLERLEQTRAQHRELLASPPSASTLSRLRSDLGTFTTLDELRAEARASKIPVLLYWTTQANVLVWVITPTTMTVKTVFLPDVALNDKVNRLTESVRQSNVEYDQKAARELYAYLIAPFESLLEGEQILVVPQGSLVTLPFEALVNARTSRFLAQDRAVSYAPSATFAARALARKPSAVKKIKVIYDPEVEVLTGEVAGLGKVPSLALEASASSSLSAASALRLLGGSEGVHVLLHGEFDPWDPLQSHLKLGNQGLSREENQITAAELLAVDWQNTHAAVFSACEGARVNIRISNEVFGLSWAPLVGGVENVVMSRWRVSAKSNAAWMGHFYASLAFGRTSPARAAATAMRAMIDEGVRHPFAWAGPQVFGR
jgi:CHAT domain-containing protein